MSDLFSRLDRETQETLLFCQLLRACPKPGFRCKREILSEQQNHRCCYCGVRFLDHPPGLTKRRQIARWFTRNHDHPQMMTIEHVKRRVEGGQPVWENEVAACYRCNTNRGPIDAFVYFDYRERILALRKRVKQVTRNETRRRKKMVRVDGVEPSTSCMSHKHSADELHAHNLVLHQGIEPRHVGV